MTEVTSTTADSEALNLTGDQPALVITDRSREPYWQNLASHLPAVIIVTVDDLVTRAARIPSGVTVILDRTADTQDRPRADQIAHAIQDAHPARVVFTGPLPDVPTSRRLSRLHRAGTSPTSIEFLWRSTPEGAAATRRGAIAELASEL